MSSLLVVAVVMGIPAVLVLLLVLTSARVLGPSGTVPFDARFPALRGAWGVTERARVVGLALAAVTAVAALALVGCGEGISLTLAPLLACLTFVLVQLVGQRLVGRSLADGAAGLEVRSVGRYVPRGLAITVGVGALLMSACLALGGWYGSYGRQLDYVSTLADGSTCSGSLTPFLGPYYVLPMAGVALLLAATSLLALRVVSARPRNGSEPAVVVADDEVRRRAGTAVLGGVGVGVWSTFVMAVTNFRVTIANLQANHAMDGGCGLDLPRWWDGALLVVGLAGFVVTLWCLGRVLRPGTRRPADVAQPGAVCDALPRA